MGNIMIKCPNTGRVIPTGMIADQLSFKSTPVFFARVLCPICRTEHEWFAKEAWVWEPEQQRGLANQYIEGVARWDSLVGG